MKKLSLIILSAFVSSVVARADMITIFNTGVVDNSGNLLPAMAPDPHYMLVSGPIGGPVPFVGAGADTLPYNPKNGPLSQFINPTPDATASDPAGLYTYTTTFILPANFSSASLSGQWETDNEGAMSLNGGPTITTTPSVGFQMFFPFTITSGFVAGVNTLTFAITNDQAGPTALRVEFTNASFTTVPDTGSSAALLGGALLALGIFRRMSGSHLNI